MGARGSIVGWGIMLQAGRSRVRLPMRSVGFVNWPNPSSRTIALGRLSLQQKWVPGIILEGKADNLAAIFQPIF
jgi:hypothetical protein